MSDVLIRDRHVRRSGEDYGEAFLGLLPQGPAWPRSLGSTLDLACRGLAKYWGDVDARAGDLLEQESDPRKTIELLPDWERNWGLPDPCYETPQGLDERQLALIMRMTMEGSQSREFFIDVAATLGYTITISEYRTWVVGMDRCGDSRVYGRNPPPTRNEWGQPLMNARGDAPTGPAELSGWPQYGLGPHTNRFYWTVYVSDQKLIWFRCASGECGVDPHLRLVRADDLECLLNRWKPAHTEIIFDYSTQNTGVFDFVNNEYTGIADTVTITCTRSTAGYIDDLAGNWTPIGPNILRRSDKGLLNEEARTNRIRNNSMQGAVAGTPGVSPTFWTISTGGIPNRSIVAKGTINGIDYIDIRFWGVPTATGPQIIVFDAAVGAIGETWSNSLFLALNAGDMTNLAGGGFTLRAGGEAGGTTIIPTSALTRYTNVRVLGAADGMCTFRWSYIDTVTPVDFTIRIGWPQSELGTFVTSPIRTTNAVGTRAGDLVTVTGFSLAPTFWQFAEFVPLAPVTHNNNQYVLQLESASTATTRSLFYRILTSGAPGFYFTINSTLFWSSGTGSLATNAIAKMAASLAPELQNGAYNGTSVVGQIAGSIFTPTVARIGCNNAGAQNVNGYIRKVSFGKGTKTPDQLKAMTS